MDQVDPSWLMVLSCRPGSKLLAGLLYCCAVTDGLQPIVYRYELAADARRRTDRHRWSEEFARPARGARPLRTAST
jgi:hypothetical protein